MTGQEITKEFNYSDSSERSLASAYLLLLRQAITASLYPESGWLMLNPSRRSGLVGKVKSFALRYMASREFTVVKRLPFDAEERANGRDWPMFGYSMVGHRRLENLEYCIRTVVQQGIEGDIVECGVWKGGASIYAKGVLKSLGVTDRKVWLADSFEGMPEQREEDKVDPALADVKFLSVSLQDVQRNFDRFGLLDENVKFIKGWFADSLASAPIKGISVLRLDGDYYSSTMDALNALFDRLSYGGFVIIDDYFDFKSCRRAVEDFCRTRGINPNITPIDSNGVFWRKEH